MTNAAIATTLIKTEEIFAGYAMALTVNVVVVVNIPVSVSLSTSFIEAFALGIALLLNIVRAVFEVTLDLELADVVSLSFTE